MDNWPKVNPKVNFSASASKSSFVDVLLNLHRTIQMCSDLRVTCFYCLLKKESYVAASCSSKFRTIAFIAEKLSSTLSSHVLPFPPALSSLLLSSLMYFPNILPLTFLPKSFIVPSARGPFLFTFSYNMAFIMNTFCYWIFYFNIISPFLKIYLCNSLFALLCFYWKTFCNLHIIAINRHSLPLHLAYLLFRCLTIILYIFNVY